jgi:hypothetical protein
MLRIQKTFSALQAIMAYAKRIGIDDDHFDEFMTVADWMRQHRPRTELD